MKVSERVHFIRLSEIRRTYFRKLEEITRGLREVARIWSSWDSGRSRQTSQLSFSVDFQVTRRQNSRRFLARSILHFLAFENRAKCTRSATAM